MDNFENVVDAMNELKAEMEAEIVSKVAKMLGDDFGKDGSMDRRRWAQRITDLAVAEKKQTELRTENRKLRAKVRKLEEEFAGWKASYDDDIREAKEEGVDYLKSCIEEYKKELDIEHIRYLEADKKRCDAETKLAYHSEFLEISGDFTFYAEWIRDKYPDAPEEDTGVLAETDSDSDYEP